MPIKVHIFLTAKKKKFPYEDEDIGRLSNLH